MRLNGILLVAAAALMAPAQAAADVVSSTPTGFHIRHSVPIAATRAKAFALLTEPRLWWADAHSYSGDAANFRMDVAPGGCFCESWDAGFVKHMEVVAANPGMQIILSGGLGPLRYAPADGTMVWEIVEARDGVRLVIDYKVVGFPASDAQQIAPVVDGVLGDLAARFAARAAQAN